MDHVWHHDGDVVVFVVVEMDENVVFSDGRQVAIGAGGVDRNAVQKFSPERLFRRSSLDCHVHHPVYDFVFVWISKSGQQHRAKHPWAVR